MNGYITTYRGTDRPSSLVTVRKSNSILQSEVDRGETVYIGSGSYNQLLCRFRRLTTVDSSGYTQWSDVWMTRKQVEEEFRIH